MALITIQWNPPSKTLRNFGLLCATFSALAGALILLKGSLLGFSFGPQSTATAAYSCWAIAGLFLLTSLIYPRLNRPIYLLLTMISYPIGLVVSHLIMALLFYGIFTPIGLFFRLIGRDSLNRRLEREGASYWIERERQIDRQKYFRQY